jgi:hypothetical protein
MHPTRYGCAGDSGRSPTADQAQAQAQYYVLLLANRRQVLETEIVERCIELLKIPLAARKSERTRNIRRIIRTKQTEVATLNELCEALIERLHPG